MPKIARSEHAKRQDCVRPSSRRAYLAGASLLSLGVALAAPQQAMAANVTISTSQGGYVTPAPLTLLTITNTGTLSGQNGLNDNNGYVIQTLTNNGLITANSHAVEVLASIGTLTNTGSIISTYIGIGVTGTVDSLSNSGTISGLHSAIQVGNTRLGALSNSGTISGSLYAIHNSGTIGSGGAGTTLTNTGVIAGNIYSASISGSFPNFTTVGRNLSIAGGTGTVIGTLTGYTAGTEGTITAGNVALSGNILLNDAVSIGSGTLTNSGGLSLISIVSITGNYAQSSGALTEAAGAELVVSGAASITGGTITLDPKGNYTIGQTTTLVQAGTGSYSGITYGGNGLALTGSVSGNNLTGTVGNDYIGASTLANLANTISIGGVATAVYVAATGTLSGTLSNTGMLIGTSVGVTNKGSIGALSNASGGTIAGANTGIQNAIGVTIGTLTNSGTVSGGIGIANDANAYIGQLTNNATIAGSFAANHYGIENLGSIGSLTNNANGIVSATQGIYNIKNITTLINAGTIFGSIFGIDNVSPGTIGFLNNSGKITGGLSSTDPSNAAIFNAGKIGTLTNSGTISGSINAIFNTSGTIGGAVAGATLTNTGVIAGPIVNTNGNLSIAGGTGTVFGTLTGYAAGTEGTITNTAGNIVLSGNQVLNDFVSIASGSTLTNAGGDIKLISIVSITGNYTQATGTLTVGAGAELIVSGAATITGTVVGAGNLSATGNYLPGASAGTLVQGGANSYYVGVVVAGGGITGLAESGSFTGNNIVSTVTNYYVGTIQNSISNTVSIGGVATAVYVASTGALGSLSNSGTLSGSINGLANAGSIGSIGNSGTISGGSGSAAGISNQGSIGTLTNSGAIASNVTALANYGSIGTLANSGSIAAGVGILNTGTIAVLTVAAGGAISGGSRGIINNGSIGSLINSGSISAATGVLNANNGTPGSIGTLSNSGAISGYSFGVRNGGNIGTVADSGTIAGGNIGLFNSGSIAFVTVAAGGLIKDQLTAGLTNNPGGSIGAIAVAGSIAGQIGVLNTGTISSLSIANTGVITGSVAALYNAVTSGITTRVVLGTVSNSGVIAGNIINTIVNNSVTAQDLTFTGGSGSTYGTLTGYTAGSQGTITNNQSNVVFAAGQIFLNDAMNLGSHSFVNSGASIQINNAIAVTGNFVQTSGTLLIGATSATSYGDIVVTGNATITGGTVSVAAVGGFTLAANQTYTIVQAHGSLSVSGLTASVTNYVPVIQTITAGGYNDLILTLNTIGSTTTGTTTGTVTGTTGTTTGTTGTTTSTPHVLTYTALGNATGGAATGIGPALDIIAAGTSATQQQFYNTVLAPLNALPTAAARQRAITQLSPGQLTPQAAPIAVTPALDAITEHQNTLPGATDGLGALSRGAGAGSDGQQGALWGQMLAGKATRDQSNGAAGYGATTYGILAGADFEVTPELLAGVAIDWVTSRVTGNDALTGSTTRLSSYQFEGYGSWRPDRFDGRLTFDGQLGFGQNSYNQHRAISYLNEGANAHFDGQQYVASVLAGYRLDIQGPVEVAPYLRFRETHLVNGGYSETGAGLADLAVNGVTTDSFTHEVGVKAGMEFDTTYGKWFPAVKLGWIHDYTSGPIALTGNLLGGTVFTSATSQPGADGAALGLTLDLKRTDSFSLSIEYDGEFHKDFTSNTGLVNGTWKF